MYILCTRTHPQFANRVPRDSGALPSVYSAVQCKLIIISETDNSQQRRFGKSSKML